MTNPIVEKVETWLWQIAAKKGAQRAAQAVVAIVTGVKLQPILTQAGVHVDAPTLQGSIATAIMFGLEFVRNWAKVKFNLTWL